MGSTSPDCSPATMPFASVGVDFEAITPARRMLLCHLCHRCLSAAAPRPAPELAPCRAGVSSVRSAKERQRSWSPNVCTRSLANACQKPLQTPLVDRVQTVG